MKALIPTEADVRHVVDVVVAEIAPLRVVLFGSVARGEQRADSDIDLMVVVPEDADRRAVLGHLYMAMLRAGIRVPTQFVVTTPSSFEHHQRSVGLVYRDVVRDGRDVYVAA